MNKEMKNHIGCAFLFSLVITSSVSGQEVVTLTTPEAKPSNTNYHVERVTSALDDKQLLIQLKGVNGEALSCAYTEQTTPTGEFLNNALNKANLASTYAGNATTGTLKQRIFHRLVVMGEALMACGKVLTGTIAGSVP